MSFLLSPPFRRAFSGSAFKERGEGGGGAGTNRKCSPLEEILIYKRNTGFGRARAPRETVRKLQKRFPFIKKWPENVGVSLEIFVVFFTVNILVLGHFGLQSD